MKCKLVTTYHESDSHKVDVSHLVVNQSDQRKPLEFVLRESYFPQKETNMKTFYRLKTGREKIKLMKQYRANYFITVYREN